MNYVRWILSNVSQCSSASVTVATYKKVQRCLKSGKPIHFYHTNMLQYISFVMRPCMTVLCLVSVSLSFKTILFFMHWFYRPLHFRYKKCAHTDTETHNKYHTIIPLNTFTSRSITARTFLCMKVYVVWHFLSMYVQMATKRQTKPLWKSCVWATDQLTQSTKKKIQEKLQTSLLNSFILWSKWANRILNIKNSQISIDFKPKHRFYSVSISVKWIVIVLLVRII